MECMICRVLTAESLCCTKNKGGLVIRVAMASKSMVDVNVKFGMSLCVFNLKVLLNCIIHNMYFTLCSVLCISQMSADSLIRSITYSLRPFNGVY